jgi:hypothetical protein
VGNSAILLGVITIYSLEREVVFHFLVSICWNRHGKNLAESQILRHSSDEGKRLCNVSERVLLKLLCTDDRLRETLRTISALGDFEKRLLREILWSHLVTGVNI